MAYEGKCHCGAVAFTVGADLPAEATRCNCSHCRAKGLVLTYQPAEAVTLTQGEDTLVTYMFNRHRLQHRLCGTCGTQVFTEGKRPDGSGVRAVNLRAVPSCDLESLALKHYDGAAL